MRHFVSVALMVALVSTSALADTSNSEPSAQPELRAGPSEMMQRSHGCLWGAVGGTVLSAVGTAGIGTVPAAGIGCGVGALSAPAAIELWKRWRYDMAQMTNKVRYGVNRGFDKIIELMDGFEHPPSTYE